MTPPRLARTPFASFAAVMGLAGLAGAWGHAARLLAMPQEIATILLIVAATLWLALLVVQIARLIRHRAAVRTEVTSPFAGVFVSTFTVGSLALAAAAHPYLGSATAYLWWPATVLHLIVSVHVFGMWLARSDVDLTTLSPAWFIPVVGTMVSSFAGAWLAPTAIAVGLWALGFLLWFSMQAIVLRRIFVADRPLPPRLRPTLAILVAPPAVALIGWHALIAAPPSPAFTGAITVMMSLTPVVDAALVATGLFFAVLVLLPRTALYGAPFTLTWWATSFPFAALASAIVLATAGGAYWWLGSLALGGATGWILLLVVRSMVAVRRDIDAFL
ncbi:MAG: hypothetical protein Q4P36_01110 [Bowdeniella nasicola]|nr:hypothetical protein [Bowdeniella nasicola]